MAKKKSPNAKKFLEFRDFLEDLREFCPEHIPAWREQVVAMPSPPLLKAANELKLDLADPLLLHILGKIVFPPRGRTKGSNRWRGLRLQQLGEHWREVEQANPGISDSKAAKEIKKRYPKLYQSADTIRPRLPDARLAAQVWKANDEDPRAQMKESMNWTVLMTSELESPNRNVRRYFMKKIGSLMSTYKTYTESIQKAAHEIKGRNKPSLA
jgi:hypothetical protein